MNHARIRRERGRSLALALVVFALCTSAGVAQVAPADSLRGDTLIAALPDSLQRVDSVDPVRPFFPTSSPFGSIIPATSPGGTRMISELALATMRYYTAFDAMRRIVPAHPLSQGMAGLVRGFSYAGASPSAVSASFNGRPLPGLAAYGYDLELYPMEFAERTEILTGLRALVYGTGEALMAVNVVQPRLDVEGSYARTWYAQDDGDLTGGEILFSRNVGRRANLALGFRRLATGEDNGDRSENQSLTGWNIHGNVTWRPTPGMMLSLTELFSDVTRGQNGGLTPRSTFNPLSLGHEVYNTRWQEQTLRHDVTLAAEWILGGARRPGVDTLLAAGTASGGLDSALRIDLAVYASYGERRFVVGDSTVVLAGAPLEIERGHYGMRGGLWIPMSFARLEVNALAELRGARSRGAETTTFDLGQSQAGVLVEFPAGSAFALRFGGRYSQGDDGRIGGGGIEAVVTPNPRFTARLGARVQKHDCPCDDPMGLRDSIAAIRFEDYRTSFLGEASIAYQDSSTLLSLHAFGRRAEPVEGTVGLESQFVTGAEARWRLPFWILAFEGHAHGLLSPEGEHRFPALRAFGDLYAPLRLINGTFDLRVGTTLEYQTPFAGALYDIVTGSFAYHTGDDVAIYRQFPLWDAYAQARIGSAYLRLAMRNILDVEAWSTFRYPERGRSIVFEVTWSFID